jgi:hypothetical protein
MKYMIMLYGSQQDFDVLSGKSTDGAAWSPQDAAATYAFLGKWNEELVESGEFVDARGAPPTPTKRPGSTRRDPRSVCRSAHPGR